MMLCSDEKRYNISKDCIHQVNIIQYNTICENHPNKVRVKNKEGKQEGESNPYQQGENFSSR